MAAARVWPTLDRAGTQHLEQEQRALRGQDRGNERGQRAPQSVALDRQGTSTIAVRGATEIVGPETVLPDTKSVSEALGNPLTFCVASPRLTAT